MKKRSKEHKSNSPYILIVFIVTVVILTFAALCENTRGETFELPGIDELKPIDTDSANAIINYQEIIVDTVERLPDSITIGEYDTLGNQVRSKTRLYWRDGKVFLVEVIGYCSNKSRRYMALCPEKSKWYRHEKTK